MRVRTGQRLQSQVCTAEFIVIKAPDAEIDLTAGGQPVVEVGADVDQGLAPDSAMMGGTALGKRYVGLSGTLEVLVTKPGAATLANAGQVLQLKAPNPLPSTD
ncbi:hypothetical protein [Acrocarpospora catenulata]|uniref:hypothetical protein n=1 Tax=Acrocarpospora catenulata TaxID=2836182 RepID=UPI001BDB5FFE|nr:hypothetical protein [Acrocarpospora catenulata]